MPYLAYSTRDYEAFDDPGNTLQLGANWFINGHHAKNYPGVPFHPLETTPVKRLTASTDSYCKPIYFYKKTFKIT